MRGKGTKIDAIDSPLGSTAIGGAVSTVFVLKRTENYRTIQSVQRIGSDMAETVLEFDADSRRLSLGGTRLEVDQRGCGDAIVRFLSAADGPQTQEQIRDGVEGKTTVIRAALTTLVESARVIKTGERGEAKPFMYEFPYSGSQDSAGTREPECEGAQAVENKRMLVPGISQESILVPNNRGRKSGAESGPNPGPKFERGNL